MHFMVTSDLGRIKTWYPQGTGGEEALNEQSGNAEDVHGQRHNAAQGSRALSCKSQLIHGL